MPSSPNKLSRLWQELKRRNVIRVITVYAGAAFVLLELVDMITEPFGLPAWTFKLAVVILSLGFVVAVILSWIYDIHPEGGMVKTEPVYKVKSEDLQKSSSGWRIASYISFVVIVGLIVLNIIPRPGKKEILDKSVAVLPFIDDSPDKNNEHIINGIMEDLLINLQTVKELRVPGRTSTELYRNNPKPIPEIAREMNVAYVVEGSGQRYGDKIRLRVQLLEGKTGTHVWANSYDEVINGPEDIFRIQSEVAQLIAAELKVVITPAEKQLIEKVSTTSLMANELYQRGRDEYIRFLFDINDRDALMQAQEYYLQALEYDSTFAKACAGVAMTFHDRLDMRGRLFMICSEGYLEDDAFDTVLFWANKALHFDNQLPEAYYSRATYYFETGNREKAEQDYKKALRLNPNFWEAYNGLGNLYAGTDFKRSLEYFLQAATLVRGPELSYILTIIIQTYMFSGLLEQADSLNTNYLSLTQDSLLYFMANFWLNSFGGNPEDQHYWANKAYTADPADPVVLSYLAESYIEKGNFKEGLKYYKQSYDLDRALGRIPINRLHRMAYAFAQAGHNEEAAFYFDRAEEICKSIMRLKRPYAQFGWTQFDLALIYAFRGEKLEAMKLLRELHQRSSIPYLIAIYLPYDPMLDSIRDDPEFQQIANDFAIKYQAERERVRKWLEENDML